MSTTDGGPAFPLQDLRPEMERALKEREAYRHECGQLDENYPPPPPQQLQWRLLNLEIAVLGLGMSEKLQAEKP